MTKSEIYYFTARCLMLDEDSEFRENIIELCKYNLIDWTRFVAMCDSNYVLPAIYLKFKTHHILDFLPQELSKHLLEIYELNCERNKAIIEQIKSITAILSKQDIFPIFLKGAGNLVDDVYGDIGERLMIDIDFLVPEEDFLKSAEILINNGYLRYREIEILEVWKWNHYPPLYHPDYPAPIEIHRIPTHHKRSWFNPEIINTEKNTVSALPGCFVPSFRHRIIHNFIHSQLSHKGYLFGNVLMRDIYELHLLSKQYSLNKTLPQVKKRKKAIAYFAFARTVFNLDEQFFPKQNLKYRILKKKHELVHNSPTFRKFYLGLISRYLIVKDSYVIKFFKAFYSKEIRRSLKEKLRNQRH
jgi:hypothetical protein